MAQDPLAVLPETVLVQVLAYVAASDPVTFQYAVPQVCPRWAEHASAAHALGGGRLAVSTAAHTFGTAGPAADLRNAARRFAATSRRLVLGPALPRRRLHGAHTVDFRMLIEVLAQCPHATTVDPAITCDATMLHRQQHLIPRPHAPALSALLSVS